MQRFSYELTEWRIYIEFWKFEDATDRSFYVYLNSRVPIPYIFLSRQIESIEVRLIMFGQRVFKNLDVFYVCDINILLARLLI